MNSTLTARLFQLLTSILILISLTACATNPTNPQDPYENFNRKVFNFNEKVDTAVVKPIATAYTKVTPSIARKGVNNFFANLADLRSIVNGALQLKPQQSLTSLFRVLFNTTIGFAGLIDWATELKIEKHNLDFGSTLARWHVPQGNYLILPFLGPATFRSATGTVIDSFYSPTRALHRAAKIGYLSVYAINLRANLLDYEKKVDQGIILDKYSVVRDVFLRYDAGKLNKVTDEEYHDDMDWYDEDNDN